MSENLENLKQLAASPATIKWFKGLVERAHIEITDTGENFSIIHHGDSIDVETGFHAEHPNFIIPLDSQNVRNLVAFFSDDEIDEYEEYRIVKFMFKPCLRAVLEMPVLRNKQFRAVVRADEHWQEAILDPDGREDEQLTVVWVNDQWLIIPGYYGHPQRRLVMTPKQVLEFQRRLLEADNSGSIARWVEFGRWYVKWREEVTVAVVAEGMRDEG